MTDDHYKFDRIVIISEQSDQTGIIVKSSYDLAGISDSGSVTTETCMNFSTPFFIGYQETDVDCSGRYLSIESIHDTLFLTKFIALGSSCRDSPIVINNPSDCKCYLITLSELSNLFVVLLVTRAITISQLDTTEFHSIPGYAYEK